MRRAAIIGFLLAVGLTALLVGADEQGNKTYRVDAIFDDTAGLINGQDVKIAGTRVGAVSDIVLSKERKARVQMEIEPGFAPFRSDADCIIRPQSIIGEKFVQCDPGTPNAKPLRDDGVAPTVPIGQTHSPIDLDLVFSTFRLPYRQRLTIFVNELGTGLAGRPRDLSAAIQRANPAIQQTNKVLAILDRDRDSLGRLAARSDQVLGEVAGHSEQVQSFIERADVATQAAASRRDELSETVRLLPPLLDELEPSAARLAELSREATPVVAEVRGAAPALRNLFADLDPLTEAAVPTLAKLSELSQTGRGAVRAARPVAKRLRGVTRRLPPIVRTATALFNSLRERGVVEGLQLFAYNGTLATSRFDETSHILPAYVLVASCQQYATTPTPECNSRFNNAPVASDPREREGDDERGRSEPPSRGPSAGPAPQQAPAPQSAPEPDSSPALPGLPELPSAPQGNPSVPERLLDFLLGN